MREDMPYWKKYSLSVEEASIYFGIGVKRLYDIIRNNKDSDFLLEVGSHYRIKRAKFEEYLDQVGSL